MNPFPDYFAAQIQKAKLIWPLPVLFVVNIGDLADLDVNSARTETFFTEKWLLFEEVIAYNFLKGLSEQVSEAYFIKLLTDIQPVNKSTGFKNAMARFGY